jgi:protein-S-isoprenylcysteine O-methyltransferase Ste14
MLAGFAMLAVMLFVPAGTWQFYQAWVLLGVLFVPMAIMGAVMLVKNPELLSKRLNVNEKEQEQKWVVALSGLLFVANFVVAGLNFRYGWCVLPWWLVAVASVVFLFAYALYAEVLRENAYLSRTIEVQENQQVISTGLYGIVRHPMYSVTVLLFLSMQLVLASPLSFLIMLLYLPIINVRIKNEERVLTDGLKGYAEYKEKVRYRLLPLIW